MKGFAEYEAYDAVGLAGLVRQKKVSPAELLEAAIARVEARNGAVNAVTTVWFNLTGQPATMLPLGTSPDGLPVAVQCVARYGDEATLFRLAAQLEAARPWIGRRPKPAMLTSPSRNVSIRRFSHGP